MKDELHPIIRDVLRGDYEKKRHMYEHLYYRPWGVMTMGSDAHAWWHWDLQRQYARDWRMHWERVKMFEEQELKKRKKKAGRGKKVKKIKFVDESSGKIVVVEYRNLIVHKNGKSWRE